MNFLRLRSREWLSNLPIQDPVERRMAVLVQVILLGFIAIVLIAAILNLLIPGGPAWQVILIRNFVFLLIIGFPLALLRRGHFRSSVLIIIGIFFLLETIAVTTANLREIAETLPFFTLAILLAGLLLGRRALVFTFIGSAIVIIFNVIQEESVAARIDSLVIASNFILLNGLIGLFLDQFGLTLRQALTTALEREGELRNEIIVRKQTEEELRQSEERFSEAFQSNPAGMAILQADNGPIIDINDGFSTILGFTREEAIGHSTLELDLMTSTERKRAMEASQLHGGSLRNFELQVHRKDGAIKTVLYSSERIHLAQGPCLLAIFYDITGRKEAEKLIQRQLNRLKGLRAIDIAISSSFDIHIILEIFLQQVVSQLGVDAAAVLLFNASIQRLEYAARVGFRSNALQYSQLKIGEGYAGRAALERQVIHMSNVLERSGRLAQALISANEDFVDYYGIPLIAKGEIQGVLEIYHRTQLQANNDWLDFMEALAGQAAIAIENAQLFENLQHANTELEQRVAKRTEELSQMNIELERANRAKDEFLATMSHELRSPLNSVLGLSESLLEQRSGSLNDYQQKSLQLIESSGRHLLALINDILDLSKIQAGKLDFYPQIITVDELCRACLALVREQALRKSVTIIYQEETAVSKIYADPRRLKQILVNLLTNAVKFTLERGQIILQVHAEEEQDLIQFSVIDNGIGIAPQDLRKLFTPFVQVDSNLNRQHEGTGLGLALVQKLTDLHGGSVQVESEVGKGSRFTINLPWMKDIVAQQEVIEAGGELSIGEQPGRSDLALEKRPDRGIALLAEDNMANTLTIGDFLENQGYQVVVAHDGVEAIQMAEEKKPNIILMDIQMPAMDGLEAIRRLRDDPRFASTPIIALTALAMPGDRERCLQAGANEYLSKPVRLKQLVKMMNNLLS